MAVTTASTNHDSFRRMIKHYNAGDLDGYLAGYAPVHGENSQGGVGGVIRQRQAFRWGLDGRGRSRWALGDHHGAGLDGRDRLGRFVRAGAGSDVNDAAHVDQRLLNRSSNAWIGSPGGGVPVADAVVSRHDDRTQTASQKETPITDREPPSH